MVFMAGTTDTRVRAHTPSQIGPRESRGTGALPRPVGDLRARWAGLPERERVNIAVSAEDGRLWVGGRCVGWEALPARTVVAPVDPGTLLLGIPILPPAQRCVAWIKGFIISVRRRRSENCFGVFRILCGGPAAARPSTAPRTLPIPPGSETGTRILKTVAAETVGPRSALG